ncbi:MAG: bifunctional UDP-N-acetylmuramoyl-tripeptide:D-alanyl-D-alanine ligase/alanine racemase [Bacteroidota bacterium]
MIRFSDLPDITQGQLAQLHRDQEITGLSIDSRKAQNREGVVFLAIKGERHDGHDFIQSLYDNGVRQFVIEKDIDADKYPEANILRVQSSVAALQQVVANHRSQFNIPVIGITGSNGKTITKEWLSQLLSPHRKVISTPYSYNSQVGVPLAVWSMSTAHEIGIFEAGISKPNEMAVLNSVIQPTIGMLTNIGSAHDEGFIDRKQKLAEKTKLFDGCELVIYCKDHRLVDSEMKNYLDPNRTQLLSWGRSSDADIVVNIQPKPANSSTIEIAFQSANFQFEVPFADEASIENLMHCIAYMLYAGYTQSQIQEGIKSLNNVKMRLELKQGINGCYLVDDSYNNDLGGLNIALDFLSQQQQRDKKTVILSDIMQSGRSEAELYQQVNQLLEDKGVDRLIGVGDQISRQKDLFKVAADFYQDTDTLINALGQIKFSNEMILVKGAREFEFERIVSKLQQRIHGTVLEIDLDALTHNLNFYRSKLKPGTELMVMVKAFAYGSGSFEVAHLLQFNKVDYLAVAYVDEGVALRQNGITLPIMVMNPGQDNFDQLMQYDLEPEIYSLSLLSKLIGFLDGRPIKIQLKIETGMHRLGFENKDLSNLISLLQQHPNIQITCMFSHLAGADESQHDAFSRQQVEAFKDMTNALEQALHIKVTKHILNSAGIVRYPEYHFDMVRLGIGLYGIEANQMEQNDLRNISTLKTIISQIKTVDKGETVGYGRKGEVVKAKSRIATIALGYADGFSRALSNGVGEVLINGHMAPVIGNVCMDMTMIDITGIDAKEGDEVIIFGDDLSIRTMADKLKTIPYEILTNVSQRVKRVFHTS